MSGEIIAQNADSEITTSQDLETQQDVDTGAETDTAPQGSENPEETPAQGTDNSDGAEGQAEPFLEIQYNHEKRGLSREEAASFAQKGIYYEGTYNTLERVATLKGQTVEEFLSGIETAQDEAYRQELISKFGEDSEAVTSMMELYQMKKQQTLDGAKEKRQKEAEQAEQNTNQRLANEFTAMKADFPELTDFASLPDAVKKAASDGMSLSHAYLLHMHKENQKIAAAQKNADDAAKKSTGSIGTNSGDEITAAETQYLNALWGR